MQSLTFSLYGTPRPQPRPRFVGGRVVSTADPKAKLWRAGLARAVRAAIELSGLNRPLFGEGEPLALRAMFTFEPPVGKMSRLGQPHTHKPDADNLCKLVADVMEEEGVFKNDSQIASALPIKVWGARAGVSVVVEPFSAAAQAPVELPGSGAAPDWMTQGD